MAEQRLARKYDYLRVLPSTMHPALVLFLRRFHQDEWFDRMPHVILGQVCLQFPRKLQGHTAH